jgi:hypothetical protein
MLNVSCIVLALGSTFWTNLWWHRKLALMACCQTKQDGHRCVGNACWAHFMNEWFISYSLLLPAIEAYSVNNIHMFSCIPEYVFNTMIKWNLDIKLNLQSFVGHEYQSLTNNRTMILWISDGNIDWNPSIESIEIYRLYAIAALEQLIIGWAWCTMPAMKTIIGMIHLLLKCRHTEHLSFSGLDVCWWYPHTSNYESPWSSSHSGQWDQKSSPNWWL